MPDSTTISTTAGKAAKQSPRRSHPERVELSDRLMFEAAEALILELGTAKTTLKEVGERAGYSRGLAHSRFGNRETLFLKLADRCRHMWLEELQKAAGYSTGLAAFLTRLDAIVNYASRYPDKARVMYILWFESVGSPTAMKSSLAQFHQQARDDIRDLIVAAKSEGEVADDVDPEHFALHFTATVFGLCYQWLVNPEALDIPQMMAGIKRQMLMLLRPGT